MPEQKKIGVALAFTLIAIAVITDLTQAILTFLLVGVLINPAIDVLVSGLFAIILAGHGGGILQKRVVSMVLTTIGEFIPGVNALPLWTTWSIFVVASDRALHNKHLQPPPQMRQRKWRL